MHMQENLGQENRQNTPRPAMTNHDLINTYEAMPQCRGQKEYSRAPMNATKPKEASQTVPDAPAIISIITLAPKRNSNMKYAHHRKRVKERTKMATLVDKQLKDNK